MSENVEKSHLVDGDTNFINCSGRLQICRIEAPERWLGPNVFLHLPFRGLVSIAWAAVDCGFAG